MVYFFRLFISGDTARSRNAIDQAEQLCGQLPEGRWKLEVIDVLSSADKAEEDGILATPTLLCHSPYSKVRVVGGFRVDELLLRFLPSGGQMM